MSETLKQILSSQQENNSQSSMVALNKGPTITKSMPLDKNFIMNYMRVENEKMQSMDSDAAILKLGGAPVPYGKF